MSCVTHHRMVLHVFLRVLEGLNYTFFVIFALEALVKVGMSTEE